MKRDKNTTVIYSIAAAIILAAVVFAIYLIK